jgi:hypothetical protein
MQAQAERRWRIVPSGYNSPGAPAARISNLDWLGNLCVMDLGPDKTQPQMRDGKFSRSAGRACPEAGGPDPDGTGWQCSTAAALSSSWMHRMLLQT